MLTKLIDVFTASQKKAVSQPVIVNVTIESDNFRLPHQGKTNVYKFYSATTYIGFIETELWKENNLVLVHNIESSKIKQKHGTAMINWLISNTTQMIQPVHVIGGGISFWFKQNERWPTRIVEQDLRCSEYNELLEKRKKL